jgi:hypothetical protein
VGGVVKRPFLTKDASKSCVGSGKVGILSFLNRRLSVRLRRLNAIKN